LGGEAVVWVRSGTEAHGRRRWEAEQVALAGPTGAEIEPSSHRSPGQEERRQPSEREL